MRIKIQGINLLPREYIIAETISFYQKIGAIVVLVWTLCFIVFIAIPPKQEVVRTRDLLLEKQQEVTSSRYAGVNKTLSDLEQAKTDMQMLIDNYNKLKDESYISGQLLDTLISRVPSNITIQTININAPKQSDVKQINMKYTAASVREGQSYLTIIEILFPKANVRSEYSYNQEDGTYNYIITIEDTTTKAVETPETPETPTTVAGEGATS